MDKLDRYDAQKLLEAKKMLPEVRDYNNVESSPLYGKNTVISKLEKILYTELEPELQEGWSLYEK